MKYHDVLPIISLSRMSVYAYNLAWKKILSSYSSFTTVRL